MINTKLLGGILTVLLLMAGFMMIEKHDAPVAFTAKQDARRDQLQNAVKPPKQKYLVP